VNHQLEAGDRIILLAEEYETSAPAAQPLPTVPWDEAVNTVDPVHAEVTRVLLLGWNHKAPALLDELQGHTRRFEIDVLSRVPIAERQVALERFGFMGKGVVLHHHLVDITSGADLKHFDVSNYATAVILASDWIETDSSADSRTILGYLVLQERLANASGGPNIIVELLNPENRSLFENKPCEVITTPVLASNVLTHVALRHELLEVFEELFAHDGADISFVPVRDYVGERQATFAELRAACLVAGQVAIGMRTGKRVVLNPPRDAKLDLARSEVIVLIPRWLLTKLAPNS
jgi:hypothetical protein